MTEHEERNWLSASIDGELTAGEQARLSAHLSGCSSCRLELEELRTVRDRLRAAPRRAMPPELLARVESTAGRPWTAVLLREARLRWVPLAATGAALVLALWIGVFRQGAQDELPIEVLAAAHSRYSAEGLIPGDLLASNFSADLAQTNDN